MFNWFHPRCPVEPNVKAWVERRMCWLVSQFGRERLLDGKVILPTEEFFPAPYDHSEDGARILLDQVCRYMDVDPASVDLFFYSERQPVALNIEVVRPEGGTAGLYREQNGRTTISLEVSRLADPISVVATFAHELCHAHLLGGGRLSPKEEDHEPLTDLATVYFGMGIFIANATLRDKSYQADTANLPAVSADTPTDAQFTQAVFLMQQGQWEEAVRLLSEVLMHDPRDGEAYQQRALAYLGLGTWKEALTDAEQAVRSSPDDSESFRVRGMAYLESQQCARAVVDFTRYLEAEDVTAADPVRVSRVYYSRGTAYTKDGELSRAIADFTKAIRRWPQWPVPYEARACAYERLGKTKKALADREEAAQRAKSLGKHESAPELRTCIIHPPGIG